MARALETVARAYTSLLFFSPPPQTQGELTDGGLFEIFQHKLRTLFTRLHVEERRARCSPAPAGRARRRRAVRDLPTQAENALEYLRTLFLEKWHAPAAPRPQKTQGELTDGGLFEIFQHEFGMPGSKRFETARLNFLKSCAGWGRGGQAGGRKTMGLLSTYYSS